MYCVLSAYGNFFLTIVRGVGGEGGGNVDTAAQRVDSLSEGRGRERAQPVSVPMVEKEY